MSCLIRKVDVSEWDSGCEQAHGRQSTISADTISNCPPKLTPPQRGAPPTFTHVICHVESIHVAQVYLRGWPVDHGPH